MLNISPKVTQVGVEPILPPSDDDAYQHYAFIVVLLLLNFMEQTFIPDLCTGISKSRIHGNFTKSSVVDTIPTAPCLTLFYSESGRFAQFRVAHLLLKPLGRR